MNPNNIGRLKKGTKVKVIKYLMGCTLKLGDVVMVNKIWDQNTDDPYVSTINPIDGFEITAGNIYVTHIEIIK